jgi:DNA-binding NarL/FixJ family response regulator
MPRATVLLADDHALVAEGLASLLGSEFTVVGTATDGPSSSRPPDGSIPT